MRVLKGLVRVVICLVIIVVAVVVCLIVLLGAGYVEVISLVVDFTR